MYGIVGGQQGIDSRFDTESIVPGENRNLAPKSFSQFQGGGYGGGNLGIRYDANGFLYPGNMSMGWMDVSTPKLALDITTRTKIRKYACQPSILSCVRSRKVPASETTGL